MNRQEIDRWNNAVTLVTESTLKPDHELRQCAHNQNCYSELMNVRENILDYLNTLRK